MRDAGSDPTATPEAQRRRAAGVSKQRKAAIAWSDDGSPDTTDFRRDILPKLQGITVRVIADALGISQSHSSKVRCGKTPPRKRHWKALGDLADAASHAGPKPTRYSRCGCTR
jgi:hypothetical protein